MSARCTSTSNLSAYPIGAEASSPLSITAVALSQATQQGRTGDGLTDDARDDEKAENSLRTHTGAAHKWRRRQAGGRAGGRTDGARRVDGRRYERAKTAEASTPSPSSPPPVMSTFEGSLSQAHLDRITAGLVCEVKTILDEDIMAHQASVNRRFRELLEEIQRMRNSVETVKQRLSEFEREAANTSAADDPTVCHGCQGQQHRSVNRDFVHRSTDHHEYGGAVDGLDRSVDGLDRSVEGPIPPAHEKNNTVQVSGENEIEPQRLAVSVRHLDGTVMEGRGSRVETSVNLNVFFSCLGAFFFSLLFSYLGAILSG
ncbi:uncharacterized protein SCHCODRAFT_02492291 [Schizophyllum commune H4-8]|nr:uncharacterized protein SCHCODRAFT_02492291 [Schizophyllum commune H4-8]KAI5896175.1 hypothetical protein SCHCODRAFT_02492291 [Schizophyllum commune H4-8]